MGQQAAGLFTACSLFLPIRQAQGRLFTTDHAINGIANAQSLTILGDGAPWVWNRAPELITRLGLENIPVVEIIDWAHVVGKLASAAKVGLHKGFKGWLKRVRKLLKKGQVDKIIELLRSLDDSDDPEGVIRKAIAYCHTHRHRMQYAKFETQGLPIGSGAIESGIRRIVNLRMKSPGIFWKPQTCSVAEPNAERVLYLRCRIKAGCRLDFVKSTLTQWANDFTSSLAQANASIALLDKPA